MTPFTKVIVGGLLMLPEIVGSLLAAAYSVDHPQLTPMQVTNEWAAWCIICSVPFVAGAILLVVGMEENSQEDSQ